MKFYIYLFLEIHKNQQDKDYNFKLLGHVGFSKPTIFLLPKMLFSWQASEIHIPPNWRLQNAFFHGIGVFQK